MSSPSPSADDIGFIPSGQPAQQNTYADIGFIPSGESAAPPSNVDPELFAAYQALHRAMETGDRLGLGAARRKINGLVGADASRDALSGTSAFDRFNLGFGRGMEGVGLNLAEMAGHLPGTGDLQENSRAALRDMQESSAPLMNTLGGKLGNFGGELAATAPLMMATGMAAGPAVGTLLGTTAPYAVTPVTAALEGIAAGTTLAGPDNRTMGGLLAGAFAPVPTLGAQFLGALSRGFVKPTDAARYLMNKGVSGLTLGQLAGPESKWAQAEEAVTSAPWFGKTIANQRAEAPKLWQNAVLREVQPSTNPLATSNSGAALDAALAGKGPQTTPLVGNTANDKLANIYDSFDPAYAPIKEAQMVPQTSAGAPLRAIAAKEAQPTATSLLLDASGNRIPTAPTQAAVAGKPSAFESVIEDPAVLATDKQRAAVRKFLENETTLLPEMRPGQAPGPVSADSMLKMRSNIRKAAMQAEKDQQFAMAALLRNAEDKVSDSLNSQLPPAAREALAATDAKYAQYKTVEDAIRRSGDQGQGFTPSQLSAAVKSATERGAYARGGGGPLRELAQAGKEILENKTPVTGARFVTAGGPKLSMPIGAGLSALNSPWLQPLVLGETTAQRGLVNLEQMLKQKGLAEALRQAGTTAAAVGSNALLPSAAQ